MFFLFCVCVCMHAVVCIYEKCKSVCVLRKRECPFINKEGWSPLKGGRGEEKEKEEGHGELIIFP